MIRNVTIQHADDCFKVQVDLDIDADRDYQLFTALDYKISLDEDWRLIDMHLKKPKFSQSHSIAMNDRWKSKSIPNIVCLKSIWITTPGLMVTITWGK